MKIASLISESLLKAGGYEIFTYNLLTSFARKGHEVLLYITDHEYRKNAWFYRQLEFDVRSLPWNSMSVLKRFPSLLKWWIKRENRRRGFDVWQVMGAYPEGAMVSELAGVVPLVLRTHGDDIQVAPEIGYGLRLDPELDRAIRHSVGKMDRVVALTQSVVPDFLELGVNSKHISIIPNGIHFAHFTKERNGAQIRQKWDIPHDALFILTVGRHHQKKGFDLIPALARRLKGQGVDFHWLVVGQGTDAIAPVLADQGVSDVVRPLPQISFDRDSTEVDFENIPVEELVELYSASDLFVFPSRIETFGRVLIEAMAAGSPVITTNCAGCKDVVGEGQFGVMVDVDDVDALGEAVVRLARDDSKYEKYRQAGLKRAAQFDWDAVSDSYLDLYRELIKESV